MPWKSKLGNTYRLCLLDTNAISEILKYPDNEDIGFKQNFILNKYAPCITIYNIIELRRKECLFNNFLIYFSQMPFFILKPFQFIFQDELKNYYSNNNNTTALLNAFSMEGNNSTYDCRDIINNLFKKEEIKKVENNWRKNNEETLNLWLNEKKNFNSKKSVPNASDADEYVNEAGIQTIIQLAPQFVQNELALNRVPYMDAIITEKFQANIFTKIKRKVKNLDKLVVLYIE